MEAEDLNSLKGLDVLLTSLRRKGLKILRQLYLHATTHK